MWLLPPLRSLTNVVWVTQVIRSPQQVIRSPQHITEMTKHWRCMVSKLPSITDCPQVQTKSCQSAWLLTNGETSPPLAGVLWNSSQRFPSPFISLYHQLFCNFFGFHGNCKQQPAMAHGQVLAKYNRSMRPLGVNTLQSSVLISTEGGVKLQTAVSVLTEHAHVALQLIYSNTSTRFHPNQQTPNGEWTRMLLR